MAEVQLGEGEKIGVTRLPCAGAQIGVQRADRAVHVSGGERGEHRYPRAHGRGQVRGRAAPERAWNSGRYSGRMRPEPEDSSARMGQRTLQSVRWVSVAVWCCT